MYTVPDDLLELARVFRRRSTAPEAFLWECLRGRRMRGAKFRRQHIIGRYIADFYCHEARLVVELDGPSHRSRDRREHDALRNEELEHEGFRVLRLQNEFVLDHPSRALQMIVDALSEGVEEQPSSSVPSGEGRTEDTTSRSPGEGGMDGPASPERGPG